MFYFGIRQLRWSDPEFAVKYPNNLAVYDTTQPGSELTAIGSIPVYCGGWTRPTFTDDGSHVLVSKSESSVAVIEVVTNVVVAEIPVPGASFIAIGAESYRCIGFEPPMASGPVSVKGRNRALPFKAQLFDADDSLITDNDIQAPPVIQVWYEHGTQNAEDVSDDALPAGASTEGNQFFFDDNMRWHYNLKMKNYSAPGTYTAIIESGDKSEYLIDPSCTGQFAIN